ncbi:IS3 family transposase, partial [Noviherbaspirillum sp. 17J57-3]|nr:IS3 family transposase [Noviherbaspirillum galbum]
MEWIDRRTARSKTDDTVALQAIRAVVQDQATYGYRRVWGMLRMNGMQDGRPINHKQWDGLLLPARGTQRCHTGVSTQPVEEGVRDEAYPHWRRFG